MVGKSVVNPCWNSLITHILKKHFMSHPVWKAGETVHKIYSQFCMFSHVVPSIGTDVSTAIMMIFSDR